MYWIFRQQPTQSNGLVRSVFATISSFAVLNGIGFALVDVSGRLMAGRRINLSGIIKNVWLAFIHWVVSIRWSIHTAIAYD